MVHQCHLAKMRTCFEARDIDHFAGIGSQVNSDRTELDEVHRTCFVAFRKMSSPVAKVST